ncbi:PHB depolymerase family esterase [Rhizobium sp. NLR9b]|uniref:extracellular catalytic domain type 1 short-chain-length polyhydroxyalkanoate depolymerase n=1 Tax=unclassified Rhizobium TaxID=2613769 RepID=UPI001C83B529|nr:MULTISPECIES: PHB depolymerase family esterase [unclassified Rhizobium]MBX5227409.1 PHB depolymerase family esterase [Rhizobium sp. NLR9b]MBX5288453.1 PHB depolymerase family esterase [Rhizobium sp. NLR10b]
MKIQRSQSRRLNELRNFGNNPGNLKAFTYQPRNPLPLAPLVVVLHGCTQNADGYDRGSGWSRLADEEGFLLLYPEQQRANNQNLCFNWFQPEDTRRGTGEALSIYQMIIAMVAAGQIDPAKIFVTGLSAGGAMSAVMLATYPEIFAGGAVIGGLPYGCAATVTAAFEQMQGKRVSPPDELKRVVRNASEHDGPWPTLSVWHGTHDHTVKPRNGDQIVEQWRRIHALQKAPAIKNVNGNKRKIWVDSAGREVLEQFEIAGMAHGVPLATRGERGLGVEGPFMLETGISSTREIARFWQILQHDGRDEVESLRVHNSGGGFDGEIILPGAVVEVRSPSGKEGPESQPNSSSIARTIYNALKAAGLVR